MGGGGRGSYVMGWQSITRATTTVARNGWPGGTDDSTMVHRQKMSRQIDKKIEDRKEGQILWWGKKNISLWS